MIVVEAGVPAVHHDPEVGFEALRIVEMVDYRFGYPGVVGKVAAGSAERDDGVCGCVAVPENEAGHDKVLSGEAQIRAAGNDDLSPGFRGQGNRLAGAAMPGKENLKIAPDAIGEDDGIAGLGRLHRGAVLLLVADENFGAPGLIRGKYNRDQRQGEEFAERVSHRLRY